MVLEIYLSLNFKGNILLTDIIKNIVLATLFLYKHFEIYAYIVLYNDTIFVIQLLPARASE